MNEEPDVAYFLRRERAARDLAAGSADPRIARIHLELADRYASASRDAALPDSRRVRDPA